MRCRWGFIASLIVVSSCARGGSLVGTPFTGAVVRARTIDAERCRGDCHVAYSIRISNPTGREAHVLRCRLEDGADDELGRLMLPVGLASGPTIPAHGTRTVRWSIILSISAAGVRRLPGLAVTCQGIDWGGREPI